MSRFTRIALILALLISPVSVATALDSSDNHWTCTVDETGLWGGTARCSYFEYTEAVESDIEISPSGSCVKIPKPWGFRHNCTFTPVLIIGGD